MFDSVGRYALSYIMATRSPVRRTLILVGSVATLICLLPYGWIKWNRVSAARQYQEQLALARKEGVPTTPEEFAALMPRVAPEENAAFHYEKLDGGSFEIAQCTNLQFKLIREPSDELIEQALRFLDSHRTTLEHLDAATALEKCRFERDWNVGLIRSAGGSTAYHAAPLLKLRGTCRMLKGDTRGAIADADRIGRMAAHFGSEPSPRGQHIRENLECDRLEVLADWCYAHRGDATYLKALEERIDDYSLTADSGSVWASWVSDGAYVLDRIWTPEGRRELGIKATTFRQNLTLALAPIDTNARIIEGLRELTHAAKQPRPDRWTQMKSARQKVWEASKPLEGLIQVLPEDLQASSELFESVRLFYRTLARTFEHREIPTTLDTAGLIDPSTGKPMSYSYDGYTINIGVRQFVVKYKVPGVP